MVKIEGLTVRYKTERGYLTALSNINMEIKDSSIITVVGPSRCGKSILLHVLSGLIKSFPRQYNYKRRKIKYKKTIN